MAVVEKEHLPNVSFLCLAYFLISVPFLGSFIHVLRSQSAEQSIMFFWGVGGVSPGTINLAYESPTNGSLNLSTFQSTYKLNKDMCSSGEEYLRLSRQVNLH